MASEQYKLMTDHRPVQMLAYPWKALVGMVIGPKAYPPSLLAAGGVFGGELNRCFSDCELLRGSCGNGNELWIYSEVKSDVLSFMTQRVCGAYVWLLL